MAASIAIGGIAVEDALFQQARSIHGKEFDEWVVNLRSLLQSSDRGPNCTTLLRQFYVLVVATKYSRSLSADIYQLLQSLVLEPEQGPPKVRLLARAILCELAPSKLIEVNNFNPPVEFSNIHYILPVLLAQTNAREKLSELAPQIIKWLTQPAGHDEDHTLASLSCLHSMCSHNRALERIGENTLKNISVQLALWLRQASKSSLSAPSSGISIFSTSTKKQLFPVKEIDGTASQDMFTVLNLGGFYSSDQLLNISAFSFLRRWLLTTISCGMVGAPSPSPTPTPTQDYRRQDDPRSSSRTSSTTPSQPHRPFTSSLPSPLAPGLLQSLSGSGITSSLIISSIGVGGRMKQGLKDTAVQYCHRVIDQCERKPLKPVDEELVNACLYESISVLDILCTLSRSLVHSVFPTMRKLYSRFNQDPLNNGRLILVLVKFFLNHGESELYDAETPIDLFFGQVLSVKFNDPGLAYDTMEYLVENMEALYSTTNIFSKYFPNILKILAWSPVTFIAEFLQLLPAFISKSSVTEVLHSLLDLPCLSATLQAQHLITVVPSITEINILPQYSKCMAAFQDSTHKLMFGHFLRTETGKGDTIDRLSTLIHLLMDFSGHQRILAAAQVAPLLIKLFFKTVFYGNDSTVISQLVTVLLERTVLLYNVESFQSETRKVISEYLLIIFKLHPHLIVDHHRDLLDFLGNLRSLTSGGEHCYMHLVWILGEYSHVGYDSRCTSTLLVQYFEALESVAYEVSMNLHKRSDFTTRLLLVFMSTVAKIASRCQDLIPRALLCLNKIVQLGSDSTGDPSTRKVLLGRANELVNVLKIPSIASAVLSPTPHSSEAQEVKRRTNIAHLLQSTANHLQLQTS